MNDTATTWIIAQTKPNGHRLAQDNLRRQGFVTYLPMIDETRRSGHRFVQRTSPVFPGYIFIESEAAGPRWRAINATRGITKLVLTGLEPAEVPQALIAALRDRFDDPGSSTPSDFAQGDTIRVSAGPFSDLVGTIEKIEPKNRIWVLIDVLGSKRRVSVASRDLRKA